MCVMPVGVSGRVRVSDLKVNKAFRLSTLLPLWSSGADLRLLELVPTERSRYVAIGSLVLASSVLAAVSMGLAAHLALGGGLVSAIIYGLFSGILILGFNRFVITALGRRNGWHSWLLMAVPRLVLSGLMAAIVSVPLVLQIFAPEIRAEIPLLQIQRLNSYDTAQESSVLGHQVGTAQQTVSELRATIAAGGTPQPDPGNNPEVQSLTEQLSKAQAQEKSDYELLTCAQYGGTDCPTGTGQSVQSLQAALQSDQKQVAALEAQRNTLADNLDAAAVKNQAASLEAAQRELPAAEAQLQASQRAQQEALTTFSRSNNGAGILVQLQALAAATSRDTTLSVARWMLLLLFFAVDFLPTLSGILLRLGPATLYDKILDSAEEEDELVARQITRSEAERRYRAAVRPDAAKAELTARAMPTIPDVSSVPLPPFSEQAVPHADGKLNRLEISDEDFLLVDSLDGTPTLNWTASISAREFVRLVSERLERRADPREEPGEIFISMAGVAGQFDARLGVQLGAAASPAFDQRSEFIRFDDRDIALALQNLHGNDGERVTMFGVSAAGLALDTVTSLMSLTATQGLAAHARRADVSSLIGRIAGLTHLPRNGDSALVWHAEQAEGTWQFPGQEYSRAHEPAARLGPRAYLPGGREAENEWA
jgi:Domain of unknown function (DUF4407)